MDTILIDTFIDVARSGSFASTAKKRDVDPSSISRSIASLEKHLGARLFQRTTRSLTLTEAGALYLKRVEPICYELIRAEEEINSVQQQLKGRIRFSTSVAFGQACIVPLLPDLRKEYPELEIDIKLDDRNIDIIDEQLDFAIRLNKTADNRFIRSCLKTTKYHVCATPEYICRHDEINVPEDLIHHQSIVFDLPNYRNKWSFMDVKKEVREIAVKSQVLLSNALAIKDCTLQGLGISLLADWLVDDEIKAGKLVNLFPEYQVSADNFDTGIWIIYPERSFLPTKTRITVDFIKSRLSHK